MTLKKTQFYQSELLNIRIRETHNNLFSIYLRFKLKKGDLKEKTSSKFIEARKYNISNDNLLQQIVEELKEIEQVLLDKILNFMLGDSSLGNDKISTNEKVDCLYAFVELNKMIDDPTPLNNFLSVANLINKC